MRDFKQKKIYQLDIRELDELVEEVYGIPYDTQMGEYGQKTYIELNNMMGKLYDNHEGYWKGLKEEPGRSSIINWDNAEFVKLMHDEVVEYWKDHSPAPSEDMSSRPFEKIDDKGEHAWWQPVPGWVLNDMVRRGEIPAGDYQILVWW